MESKLGTCDRYKGEIPHVKDRKHKCDGWREQPLDYADIGENFEKIMEFCCKFADTVAKLRRTEFWQGVPATARRGKFRVARAAYPARARFALRDEAPLTDVEPSGQKSSSR